MKTVLLFLIFALLPLQALAADDDSGDLDPVVIDAPHGARIRLSASVHSRAVGKVADGVQVQVTGPMKGNWVPVKVGKKTGFIYKDLLKDAMNGKTLNRATEAGIICTTGDCTYRHASVGRRNRKAIEDVAHEIQKDDDDQPPAKKPKKVRVAHKGAVAPVNGIRNPRRGFQMVANPAGLGKRGYYHHQGQDYLAGYGAAVRAVTTGTITRIERSCSDTPYTNIHCGGGLGNFVEIRHPDGHTTIYAHLENSRHCAALADIHEGERVGTATQIGCVGASGRATGPHLFFEVKNEVLSAINPLTYLNMLGVAQ